MRQGAIICYYYDSSVGGCYCIRKEMDFVWRCEGVCFAYDGLERRVLSVTDLECWESEHLNIM